MDYALTGNRVALQSLLNGFRLTTALLRNAALLRLSIISCTGLGTLSAWAAKHG